MSTQPLLNTATQEAGLRQSALLLHAMQQQDRQWLLDQLPVAQKSQLVSLLDELQTLGIPQSPDLLQTAISQADAAREETAVREEAELDPATRQIRALDRIPPHERAPAWVKLCAVFKEEPAGLLAQVIQMHDWSWKEAAMKSLTPRKRARVEELAANSLRGPDLHAALLDAVAQRVLQAEQAPAESSPALSAKPKAMQRLWWPWRGRATGALRSA